MRSNGLRCCNNVTPPGFCKQKQTEFLDFEPAPVQHAASNLGLNAYQGAVLIRFEKTRHPNTTVSDQNVIGEDMKKILLGTTAVIALGTMTTEAFAADKIKLGLGGFMKEYLGVTNNDDVASTNSGSARDKDISQFTDTEVYFTGSTTLDNGIKVAATIEMEADQGSGTSGIDRSFLTISSDAVGSLAIGSTPHFGEGNLVRVPNASGNFDWDDLRPWVGYSDSATSTTGTTVWSNASNYAMGNQVGGDSAKLSYTSPTFSGVTVGASYTAAEAPNASDARRVDGNTLSDGYTYGIRYSGDLGGAAVKADVTRANIGTENQELTHGGLTVSMAGFTVGGGYTDVNKTGVVGGATTDDGLTNVDGNTWELGVSYATGPYTVSAAYMSAEDNGVSTVAGDDKDHAWKVAATYDMGAGVALTANYFRITADLEDTGTATTVATGKSITASGVIAGIEVGF
jgi:outer membrane protein OmpU